MGRLKQVLMILLMLGVLFMQGQSVMAGSVENIALGTVSGEDMEVKAKNAALSDWEGDWDVSWYNTEDTTFTISSAAQYAGLVKITSTNGLPDQGIAQDTFKRKTIILGGDIDFNPGICYEFIPDTGLIKVSGGERAFFLGTGIAGDNSGTNDIFDKSASSFGYYYESDSSTNKTGISFDAESISANGLTVNGITSIERFEGVFDGNGKSILNLFSVKNGLFRQATGACIKNFSVDGLICNPTSSSTAGSIVVAAEDCKIENVTNRAALFISNAQYAGGICGSMSATQNDAAQISGCVNEAQIYYSGSQNCYVGGILGESVRNSYEVTIRDCSNSGNLISVQMVNTTGGILGSHSTSNAGGIIKLTNCKNTGEIRNASFAGGIAGNVTVTATTGDFVGVSELCDDANEGHIISAYHGGGIVGNFRGTDITPVEIKDCYNTGSVDGYYTAAGFVGICGTASIKDSYTAGMLFSQTIAVAISKNYTYSAMGGQKKECPTLDNVYYTTMEGLEVSSGYEAKGCIGVTPSEMKEAGMGAKIGEDFLDGKENQNEGYPVLADINSEDHQKNITSMEIKGIEGEITDNEIIFRDVEQEANEATFTLAPDSLEISQGASISPAADEAVTYEQDEENNVLFETVYTLTAKDGTVKKYTVKLYTKATVKDVAVSPASVSVVAGYGSAGLKPVFTPLNVTNTNVTWRSENESIAKVDETGRVTGLVPGQTSIILTTEDGNNEAGCQVTVTEFIPVTGITLEGIEDNRTSVKKDETLQLTPVITPANASNQKVSFVSADETYLTVDENGLITGIKETGDNPVKVTATSEDGSYTAFVDVTVSDVEVTGIKQAFNSTRMAVGNKKLFSATVEPANASNQKIEWTSTDPEVATVSETGLVTALKEGGTIIAASTEEGSFTASCQLTVVENYDYNVDWAGAFNAAGNNTVVDRNMPCNTKTATEAWTVSVGCGAVAIVGDYLYSYDATSATMTSEKGYGYLYKVDKETGEIVDRLYLGISGGYYYGYVTYGDGNLYITACNGSAAVEIENFTILWKNDVSNHLYTCGQYVNGYLLCNGNVFDGATGEQVATLNGKYDYSSGAEVNGVFYIPDYNGVLYGFDTTTWTVVTSLTFKTGGNNLQPGVAYANGRLYWSDALASSVYSVRIKEDKTLDTDSFIKNTLGGTTVCTPVIYNNRVYVGGQDGKNGFIQVYDATTLESIYKCSTAASIGGTIKVQSTPILDTTHFASEGKVYLFAVTYTGNVVCMEDYAGKTSGELYELIKVKNAGFAYEQNACDADGAFYVLNDSGYVTKVEISEYARPKITKDLSTETVVYEKDAPGQALVIEAVPADGQGLLSYQWQKTIDSEQSVYQEIEGATENTFVPSTAEKGLVKYRCVVTTTYNDQTVSEISQSTPIKVVAKSVTSNDITVSFRLIGSTKSTQKIDLGKEKNYYGARYSNWIKTKNYKVPADATVYDVFVKALDEAGLEYKGAEDNYVSTIRAPLSDGGEWLSEMTNGDYSGWMYTVNGTHPQVGLRFCELADKDVIIWHYVDDYRYEEGENHAGGAIQGDETTWAQWLKAVDQNAYTVYEADVVNAMINALPNADELALNDAEAIEKAWDAYGELDDDQANYISNKNIQKLLDVKEAIKILSDAVTDVETKINNIGEVTLESGEAIRAAREAYDALTDNQKKAVSEDAVKELQFAELEYKLLVLEEKNKELEQENEAIAKTVSDMIAAIGDVTLDSADSISKARKAYDNLTDSQKKYVSEETLKVLEAAEASYAEQKAADDKKKAETVKVTKITISGLSHKIAAGKKLTLKATVTPDKASNKAVTWKSSNTKVATVTGKGVVTIKKKTGGKSVNIIATAKDGFGVKASFKITSMKGVVKKITLTGKASVKAGKSLKLTAKATASKGANKTLKWTSSNKKYAIISSKGVVKALKAGKGKTVKITVAATDGSGKKATKKIKIK